MNVEFENELGENPALAEVVAADTALKEWLVNYVGEQHSPDNGNVTVEMIVETVAKEFPEFLMVVAEENWMRGYHQALTDVEVGQEMVREETESRNGS
jgi:hypothetical protein